MKKTIGESGVKINVLNFGGLSAASVTAFETP